MKIKSKVGLDQFDESSGSAKCLPGVVYVLVCIR